MKRQGGFTIGLVLTVLLVLVMLGTAFALLGTGSLNYSAAQRFGDKSFFAAESGLASAIDQIAHNGALPLSPWEGTLNQGDASFSVTAFDNRTGVADLPTFAGGPQVPPGCLYLLSVGTSGSRSRQVGALLQVSTASVQAGLLADSYYFESGNIVDAFDSRLGPYGPSTVVTNAKVAATNRNDNPSTGPALDTGSAVPVQLLGTLAVGPKGNASMVDPAITYQSLVQSPTAVAVPVVKLPVGLPSFGDLSVAGTTQLLAPGEYGEVQLSGGGVVQLQPNSTYLFDALDIADTGQVSATGPNIKVYVRSRLELGCLNSLDNPSGNANDLQVFYGGSGDVEVAGGANAAYTLVAPDASSVDIKDGSVTGAVLTRSHVEFSVAGSAFHYDVALSAAPPLGSSLKVLARHSY